MLLDAGADVNKKSKHVIFVNNRYIGHGGGEKYLSSKDVKQLKKMDCAVFLIGCSSLK